METYNSQPAYTVKKKNQLKKLMASSDYFTSLIHQVNKKYANDDKVAT